MGSPATLSYNALSADVARWIPNWIVGESPSCAFSDNG